MRGAQPATKWMKKDLPKVRKQMFSWDGPAPAIQEEHLSPPQLFEKFFDEDMVNMIKEESERYAGQKGNHSFEVSTNQLRLFFAILLTSGVAVLPRRKMYWEHFPDVHNSAIASGMTRNRFEEIMQYLHLTDNNNLPQDDKLAKIHPLVDRLNEKFLENFPTCQNLSIDESMIPYFGRHGAKQFIRGKPIRFGYKMWCLCTPLGYLVQTIPYSGAGGLVRIPDLGLGGSVVTSLIEAVPKYHYNIFFDNFFTSAKLIQRLTEGGYGATGTVRTNRTNNCPIKKSDVLSKEARGSYDYRYDQHSGHIVANWNDNSVVTVASNCYGVQPLHQASRWSKAEMRRIQIDQPDMIATYNKSMGGVDRLDQNIATYRISMRSKKWWWPYFAYFLDGCVQNAWLLYRNSAAAAVEALDLLEFRRRITNTYFMRFHEEPKKPGRAGRPSPLDARVPQDVRFDKMGHLVAETEKQMRCAVCPGKAKTKCIKCNVGIHVKCFIPFHQRN